MNRLLIRSAGLFIQFLPVILPALAMLFGGWLWSADPRNLGSDQVGMPLVVAGAIGVVLWLHPWDWFRHRTKWLPRFGAERK